MTNGSERPTDIKYHLYVVEAHKLANSALQGKSMYGKMTSTTAERFACPFSAVRRARCAFEGHQVSYVGRLALVLRILLV